MMSRLRKLVDPNDAWIAGLRAVLREIAANRDLLLVADETAGTEFVRRGATRLGIDYQIDSSPPIDSDNSDGLPARDRKLIDAADVIYVLQLRTNGNLHRLLDQRVRDQPHSIRLVDLPNLQAETARKTLCASGAQMWAPVTDQLRPFDTIKGCGDQPILERHPDDVYLITSLPSADDWLFLTHTTRACPGPWPDQSFADYADDLLCSSGDADHSALGTLRRIVKKHQLAASDRMIRGGYRVVSFTACPLPRLSELHRYRPHRVRWDFEPYGICLRRDWLMSRHAQPVRYGDDQLWETLSENERPFFQVEIGESGIDWSVEREWRHVGDLDLSDLKRDQILLFVPTFEAAKSLAQVTEWPMTICPIESDQST